MLFIQIVSHQKDSCTWWEISIYEGPLTANWYQIQYWNNFNILAYHHIISIPYLTIFRFFLVLSYLNLYTFIEYLVNNWIDNYNCSIRIWPYNCFTIVFVITKPITYVGLLRLLMAFVRFMTQRNLKVFNRSYGWRKI